MMTFRNLQKAIHLSDLKSVETLLQLTLPESYKAHLLLYNGGRCLPNVFSFDEHGRRTESNVEWFLAVSDEGHNDLIWHLETYKIEEKRMPTHIVSIAHDPGGNLVCISCGVADHGKIFFWDHEREVDYSVAGDADYSNLYLIADNFEQFLAQLH